MRGLAAALGLLTVFVLLMPAAAGHPHHILFPPNEDRNGGPERVDSTNWIAQSFFVDPDFFVSRVSLYVADRGTSDDLTVSIRSNALNAPASTPRTEGTADGPATEGWLDVDLPTVSLTSGDTYWIVANSSAPGNEGYDWWSSGSETAYADGIGVTSPDGLVWAPRGRDFAFHIYGFVQPAMSFSASLANATVEVGRLTTLAVGVVNDGSGSAESVWVNVTLPAELTYVTDDAPAAGGTLTGTYSYAFSQVEAGALSFNLTLRAAPSVVDGTTALVRVEIHATDHNGAATTPFIRNLSVEVIGGPDAPLPAPESPWWWLLPLFILVPVGAGAVLVWRRRSRPIAVDEVFVADNHGLLLAHQSVSLVQYQDEDVLIGMFKAIQDFVKDTFSRGTREEFHALDFGERRILIERGRAHFIAVVYRGGNKEALMDRVRRVSQAIDENFGDVIASWNGEVEAVQGIAHLLPKLWAGRT